MSTTDHHVLIPKFTQLLGGPVSTTDAVGSLHRRNQQFVIYKGDVIIAKASLRHPAPTVIRKKDQIFFGKSDGPEPERYRFRFRTANLAEADLLVRELSNYLTVSDGPTKVSPTTANPNAVQGVLDTSSSFSQSSEFSQSQSQPLSQTFSQQSQPCLSQKSPCQSPLQSQNQMSQAQKFQAGSFSQNSSYQSPVQSQQAQAQSFPQQAPLQSPLQSQKPMIQKPRAQDQFYPQQAQLQSPLQSQKSPAQAQSFTQQAPMQSPLQSQKSLIQKPQAQSFSQNSPYKSPQQSQKYPVQSFSRSSSYQSSLQSPSLSQKPQAQSLSVSQQSPYQSPLQPQKTHYQSFSQQSQSILSQKSPFQSPLQSQKSQAQSFSQQSSSQSQKSQVQSFSQPISQTSQALSQHSQKTQSQSSTLNETYLSSSSQDISSTPDSDSNLDYNLRNDFLDLDTSMSTMIALSAVELPASKRRDNQVQGSAAPIAPNPTVSTISVEDEILSLRRRVDVLSPAGLGSEAPRKISSQHENKIWHRSSSVSSSASPSPTVPSSMLSRSSLGNSASALSRSPIPISVRMQRSLSSSTMTNTGGLSLPRTTVTDLSPKVATHENGRDSGSPMLPGRGYALPSTTVASPRTVTTPKAPQGPQYMARAYNAASPLNTRASSISDTGNGIQVYGSRSVSHGLATPPTVSQKIPATTLPSASSNGTSDDPIVLSNATEDPCDDDLEVVDVIVRNKPDEGTRVREETRSSEQAVEKERETRVEKETDGAGEDTVPVANEKTSEDTVSATSLSLIDKCTSNPQMLKGVLETMLKNDNFKNLMTMMMKTIDEDPQLGDAVQKMMVVQPDEEVSASAPSPRSQPSIPEMPTSTSVTVPVASLPLKRSFTDTNDNAINVKRATPQPQPSRFVSSPIVSEAKLAPIVGNGAPRGTVASDMHRQYMAAKTVPSLPQHYRSSNYLPTRPLASPLPPSLKRSVSNTVGDTNANTTDSAVKRQRSDVQPGPGTNGQTEEEPFSQVLSKYM